MRNHIHRYLFSLVLLCGLGAHATAFAEDRDALPIRDVIKFNYIQNKTEFVIGLEYNPADTNVFYVATSSGDIRKFHDNQSNADWTVQAPMADDEYIEAIKVSKDGRLLFAAGSNEKIYLYDAQNGSPLPVRYQLGSKRPLPIKSHYTALAVDEANQYFAAGDANGHIFVWSFAEQEPRVAFSTNDQPIKELSFDATGQILTSVSSSEVLMWNVEQKAQILRVNDILGFDNFWIESIYAPPYEPFIIIMTYTEAIVFNLQTRTIVKRYEIVPGDNGDKGQPLKAVADPSFEHVWLFHKEPLVIKLDANTGEELQGYIDQTILLSLGTRFGVYTHVALKPGTVSEFVASVFSFDINIFTGEFKVSVLLRHYKM